MRGTGFLQTKRDRVSRRRQSRQKGKFRGEKVIKKKRRRIYREKLKRTPNTGREEEIEKGPPSRLA